MHRKSAQALQRTQVAKEQLMDIKFASFLVLLTAALAGCQSAQRKAESAPPPQDVTPGSTLPW